MSPKGLEGVSFLQQSDAVHFVLFLKNLFLRKIKISLMLSYGLFLFKFKFEHLIICQGYPLLKIESEKSNQYVIGLSSPQGITPLENLKKAALSKFKSTVFKVGVRLFKFARISLMQ